MGEPDGGTIELLASCVVAVLGSGEDPATADEASADDTVAAFIANAARGEVCVFRPWGMFSEAFER